MEKLVRTTIVLAQYECEQCKRLFYVNAEDRTAWDIEFGCPYGCDAAAVLLRKITAEVQAVADTSWLQTSKKRRSEADFGSVRVS